MLIQVWINIFSMTYIKTILLFALSAFTFYHILTIQKDTTLNEKYLNPLVVNKSIIDIIKKNDYRTLDKLLSYTKLNINIETYQGNTPLSEAIMNTTITNNNFNKILRKSDVNHTNKLGFNPIHIAINSHNMDKVSAIINKPNFNHNILYNNNNILTFIKKLKNTTIDIRKKLNLLKIKNLIKNKFPLLKEKL